MREADPDDLLGRLLGVLPDSEALAERIAHSVARSIIEGRLEPGSDLNSLTLAGQFETSRTPVREALMILEKGGLVEVPARRRPRVASPSAKQIKDIYHLRALLNGHIAERVAASINEDQLEDLEGFLSPMEDAVSQGEIDRYFWQNVQFHEQMTNFIDDTAVTRAMNALGLQVLRLRRYSMSRTGRITRSLTDHQRLVQAFRDHDPILAHALARSTVLNALSALSDTAKESPTNIN